MARGYDEGMVGSNVVPSLNVLEAVNTKTQGERGTDSSVKRFKAGPVGMDSSRPSTATSSLVECGLTTTRSGIDEDRKDVQRRKFLVWNCSELSVNTARRITTIYSGIKPENYSMKKVIQPNGEKRFDLELGSAVQDIPIQKWKRVSRALHARIKRHNPMRRRSNAKPGPKVLVPMEESFSTMTYNINGIWSKRLEAFLLLEKTLPTVVALQETLRTSYSRTMVPRYLIIECVAKPGGGARGLLLAVRRDSGFTLSEFEVCDWFISGRVDGTLQDGSCIRMLVYSVYVPCAGHVDRPEAKKRLLESLLKAWSKGDFS